MGRESKQLGWGLIGPGRFAAEFCEELVRVERCRPVAVASRNAEKARKFADRFQFETAYGSYEELFADDRIDIVYIVVPHVFHADLARRAILAGKAVLCEKPLTPDPQSTHDLIELAQQRQVFLMEAMKTGFLPAIQTAKKWIDSGRIGEPRLAQADFCFSGPSDPNDRLMNPDLGGGAVLDVGIYPLHLTRFLLGDVVSLSATGSLASTEVEDSAAMVTKHASGASAVMTCSFCTDEAMSASIFGTEGTIEIPLFHAARTVVLKRGEEVVEEFSSDDGGMVTAEIEAFTDAVLEGKLECPGHTHADSLRLAELMHEVKVQVGSGKGAQLPGED